MADDLLKDTDENQEENFAEMLESFGSEMTEDLKTGDRVKGEVIHIGRDSVFVDTGTKIDGVVDRAELLDEHGELKANIGDVLDLYVVKAGESEIHLSRSMSGAADVSLLLDAMETETPVDGKVVEPCKGGFNVDISGKRAFCPISQMDVKYVENTEIYTGETFQFIIKRVEENGRNIVVSRRDYLNIGIEKARKEFFEKNKPESIVPGTVVKIMPFGAFVELATGIEGMVHISEISWSRLEKPEDGVKVGDSVMVKILSITQKEDGKSTKISLSMKQATGDPWDLVQDKFHVGDNVTGKVTRLMKFGAFVEIAPGTEGLVHISEMSYTKRVLRPEEMVTSGDIIDVCVKGIDLENKRISLSMKDAAGDPWATVETKYRPGQPVKGTLEKKEGFGYFVSLEPGITALLPKSKISQAENSSAIENTKIGSTMELVVEQVNKEERKISLTASSDNQGEDWKSFSGGSSSSGSMGSLGELLQQAMKNKK